MRLHPLRSDDLHALDIRTNPYPDDAPMRYTLNHNDGVCIEWFHRSAWMGQGVYTIVISFDLARNDYRWRPYGPTLIP